MMTDTTLAARPAEPVTGEPLDEAAVEAFAERLFGLYTGGMLTYMIDIGYRTGLFEAAAEGPATSDELAARTGLRERYVREWLGALTVGRIFTYDPASRRYRLPAEHAACLTGRGSGNMGPFSQLNTHLAAYVPRVARAFREGGGVPYAEYRPEFTGVMDGLSRGVFDELLLDAYVPLAPGLHDRLAAGARVADVGCGTGHALVLLAGAYPASEFVGYDWAEDAIEQARAEAHAAGLTNVRFEVRDVATLEPEHPFDVVFVFDAIHDQVAPARVLDRVWAALAPDGRLFMVEPRAASDIADNLEQPLTAYLYGISTLHCMTVSLAEGGDGLGTVWGEQLAREMLAAAGFGDIEAHEAPGDPTNTVYLARKPAERQSGAPSRGENR